MRQSTETFGRISWSFFVKVFSDPEVDALVHLKIQNFSTCWLHLESWNYFYEPLVSCPGCVSIEARGRIFSVTVNSNPEVDSPIECHESVRVRQGGRMAVAAGVFFQGKLITQVMSFCQLVSVTVVALTVVEWPYTHIKSAPKQQRQHGSRFGSRVPQL